jgi:hypothetical protein
MRFCADDSGRSESKEGSAQDKKAVPTAQKGMVDYSLMRRETD